MLRAVGKDAGLSVHPHTLRHSFASHMIEQGVPINYVQSMLGHRCLESTQVYMQGLQKWWKDDSLHCERERIPAYVSYACTP